MNLPMPLCFGQKMAQTIVVNTVGVSGCAIVGQAMTTAQVPQTTRAVTFFGRYPSPDGLGDPQAEPIFLGQIPHLNHVAASGFPRAEGRRCAMAPDQKG